MYVWHNPTLSSCSGKISDMEDPARAVEKLVDQEVMEVLSDKTRRNSFSLFPETPSFT